MNSKLPQLLKVYALARRLRQDPRRGSRCASEERPSGAQWAEHMMRGGFEAPHTTAAALWPCIVSRTDQIYEVMEDMLPIDMPFMPNFALLIPMLLIIFAPRPFCIFLACISKHGGL